MSYNNISLIEGEPSYESLPALKITNFSRSDIYRPYTQIKPATNKKNMYFEFLVFEAKPQSESEVCAVLTSERGSIFISVNPEKAGCKFLGKDGKELDLSEKIMTHRFDGEDLQGIYWGWDISFPVKILFDDDFSSVRGNFYKLSDGEKNHFGALFSADSSKPLNSDENTGIMELVSY